MRKLFLTLFLSFLLLAGKAGDVVAESPIEPTYIIYQSSATSLACFDSLSLTVTCGTTFEKEGVLSTSQKILAAANDERVRKLRAYFAKHKSPLEPYAYDFVYYADTYGLDWKLVPAISGVESTFGKHIPYNSYNAYGWANGDYRFTSWEDSIEHVTRTLRTKYYDRGLTNVPKIARVYAPPSATWGRNVNYFMAQIDNIEI